MRTEKEMMDIILNFAKNDERIRVVIMEGSRLYLFNIIKDDIITVWEKGKRQKMPKRFFKRLYGMKPDRFSKRNTMFCTKKAVNRQN